MLSTNRLSFYTNLCDSALNLVVPSAASRIGILDSSFFMLFCPSFFYQLALNYSCPSSQGSSLIYRRLSAADSFRHEPLFNAFKDKGYCVQESSKAASRWSMPGLTKKIYIVFEITPRKITLITSFYIIHIVTS